MTRRESSKTISAEKQAEIGQATLKTKPAGTALEHAIDAVGRAHVSFAGFLWAFAAIPLRKWHSMVCVSVPGRAIPYRLVPYRLGALSVPGLERFEHLATVADKPGGIIVPDRSELCTVRSLASCFA